MKVGDVVYRPRGSGRFDELKITKVGRKWVETDRRGIRFSKETFRIDKDFGALERVWLSLDEYHQQVTLAGAWARFRWAIDRARDTPPGMTLEKIAEALRVLGMGDTQ
jgi:hypothetical protein